MIELKDMKREAASKFRLLVLSTVLLIATIVLIGTFYQDKLKQIADICVILVACILGMFLEAALITDKFEKEQNKK